MPTKDLLLKLKFLFKPKQKYTKNNLYQRLLTKVRMSKTTCNSKCHLRVETTQYTWALFTWDLPWVNLQELSLTQDPSILQSHLLFVTTRHQATLSSKSTTQSQDHLCSAINLMKDVELPPMTCTNPTPIRFSRRPHLNSHMALQNYKDSFGKIMHAFNHLRIQLEQALFSSKCSLKRTNVRISNS